LSVRSVTLKRSTRDDDDDDNNNNNNNNKEIHCLNNTVSTISFYELLTQHTPAADVMHMNQVRCVLRYEDLFTVQIVKKLSPLSYNRYLCLFYTSLQHQHHYHQSRNSRNDS